MPETLFEIDPLPPPRVKHIKSMSLLEHLGELRRRLVYSGMSVEVGFFVCWSYAQRIFGYMQRPIVQALRDHHLGQRLVFTNPTDPFNLYLKIALVAGIFLASPFLLLLEYRG